MIPDKCKNCIHHKKTDYAKKYGYEEADFCDYIERFTDIGTPLPTPYFYKQEYPCKGHKEE